MKLFAGIAPLVCVTAPIVTLVPVVVNTAIRPVLLDPKGRVTAMVLGVAVSSIIPVAPLIE